MDVNDHSLEQTNDFSGMTVLVQGSRQNPTIASFKNVRRAKKTYFTTETSI